MRQIIDAAMIEGSVRKCRAEGPNYVPLCGAPVISVDGLSSATATVAKCLGPFCRYAGKRRKDFVCPQCQARYKVVRMTAEPGAPHPTLQCKVCRQPLRLFEIS